MVGEIMLRMEFEDDRVREMYGLGGGLGASSDVGDVGGILGDRFGDLSNGEGTSGRPDISKPYSSVSGRGGGRSTMASRS